METVLMIVLMGGALYFLMIRPQQKRAKEQKEKLNALETGARVMTVSGIVGTVLHVGEKQVILELSPGVEMTVVKQAISTQAVDDEFEYDEADATAPAAIEDVFEPSTADLQAEAAGEPTPSDLSEWESEAPVSAALEGASPVDPDLPPYANDTTKN